MMHRRSVVWVAIACLGVAVFASGVSAAVKYSEYGGGQQIWVTADAFGDRSMTDEMINFIEDPDANDPLSGSAYYFEVPDTFPEPVSRAENQENYWVEYNIPTGSVPATFNLDGTMWYFNGRTQIPGGDTFDQYYWADADWLFVNGDPGDLNMANPTEADWNDALTNLVSSDDRVFNDLSDAGGGGFVRPIWGWCDESRVSDNKIDKTFAVYDDAVTFRLYEREAGIQNARIDVMVFASDPDYVPTDEDFMNAVPEPASLSLLALAGLVVMRRRR